jgi:glucose/arabinose dehydrogenase
VSRLPLTGDHPPHPFVIDSSGSLFVNSGSATNACGIKDRTLESRGHDPCTELRTRAGIWRYDANRTGQTFSPAERYATGIRNAIGIAIAPNGALYSTQHGRDQLAENWPKLFTPEQGQNLPAEELLLIEQGGDYGWPYCYYDDTKRQLVLAPEYGGNGTDVGRCASMRGPAATFRAHWAPNGIVFYSGDRFPARYRGGAFVAFHGSWNRAPGPQEGYNVVFVPFSDGNPSGQQETFADGFAGSQKSPDRAAHRPSGLAVGADGALYISDDKAGRIWRVVYRGGNGN